MPGGFGRIGRMGGDTLRANSFNLFDWMPFLGITYHVALSLDEDGWTALVVF